MNKKIVLVIIKLAIKYYTNFSNTWYAIYKNNKNGLIIRIDSIKNLK